METQNIQSLKLDELLKKIVFCLIHTYKVNMLNHNALMGNHIVQYFDYKFPHLDKKLNYKLVFFNYHKKI